MFNRYAQSITKGAIRPVSGDEPATISPEQYKDYTGAQRLVALYMYLASGQILRPSQYAKSVGTSRYNVYRQKRSLEAMSIPIVQLGREKSGEWTLRQFAKEESPLDRIWNDAHR